jgi:hypothetical protein
MEKKISEEIHAYHGSPNKFEVFSLDAMGTGEGSEAFGWGLYFTSDKKIAEHYALTTRKKYKFFVNGKEVHGNKAWAAMLVLHSKFDLDTALDKARIATDNDHDREKNRPEVIKYVKELVDKNITEDKGNIYLVTLHKGKSPDQYDYLQWDDRPTKKLIDAVHDMVEPHPIKKFRDEGLYAWKGTDQGITNGSEVYIHLSKKLGSDKAASLYLLHHGFDGIEYPAGTLSGWKSKARNYVVFDPKEITIEKEPT